MFSTNDNASRDSARQGEEFIALVHRRWAAWFRNLPTVDQLTQFHRLYDRYQRQIAAVTQLLTESDPAPYVRRSRWKTRSI